LPAQLHVRSPGLIGDVVPREGEAHSLQIRTRGRLEAIEAATGEEKRLILAHAGAHRAQLAAETAAPAQHPRLRISASIARAGELHCDQRQAREEGCELIHRICRAETHTERTRAASPLRRVTAKLRKRHDEGIGFGARFTEVVPVIGTPLTLPQDVPHRRVP